jgi:hypothetical protein
VIRGIAQLASASALADPFGRCPGFTARVGDADVAAEADDVAVAQLAEEGEQLLVAEAAVGHDRHPAAGRHAFGQAAQAGVLVVVAPGRDLLLPDGQPNQRRRPAVARDQAQHQRRLAVMVEIGPIHRHQNVPLRADLLRHPAGEAIPHVGAAVAHQPVHLLDRMLGHQSARLCQRLADHGHRQRSARHHPKRRAGQSIDTLGVKVRPIQTADEPTNVPQTLAHMLRLGHAPNPSLADAKVLRNGGESGL